MNTALARANRVFMARYFTRLPPRLVRAGLVVGSTRRGLLGGGSGGLDGRLPILDQFLERRLVDRQIGDAVPRRTGRDLVLHDAGGRADLIDGIRAAGDGH